MDERERSRIEAICRYHSDDRISALATQFTEIRGRFSGAGRLGGGAHALLLINEMGEQTHRFADESRIAVLKVSNSHQACELWVEWVMCFQAVAFKDWEETIFPPAGRYGPMPTDLKAACENAIGHWSDKIDAFLTIGAFDFDDPPPQPKPQTGLDGWPVPGSELANPASLAPEPKPEIRRLSDKALAEWWAALGDEQSRPIEYLVKKAKEDHPQHYVARARVRAFTTGRKRGRPEIGRKTTAD